MPTTVRVASAGKRHQHHRLIGLHLVYATHPACSRLLHLRQQLRGDRPPSGTVSRCLCGCGQAANEEWCAAPCCSRLLSTSARAGGRERGAVFYVVQCVGTPAKALYRCLVTEASSRAMYMFDIVGTLPNHRTCARGQRCRSTSEGAHTTIAAWPTRHDAACSCLVWAARWAGAPEPSSATELARPPRACCWACWYHMRSDRAAHDAWSLSALAPVCGCQAAAPHPAAGVAMCGGAAMAQAAWKQRFCARAHPTSRPRTG